MQSTDKGSTTQILTQGVEISEADMWPHLGHRDAHEKAAPCGDLGPLLRRAGDVAGLRRLASKVIAAAPIALATQAANAGPTMRPRYAPRRIGVVKHDLGSAGKLREFAERGLQALRVFELDHPATHGVLGGLVAARG